MPGENERNLLPLVRNFLLEDDEEVGSWSDRSSQSKTWGRSVHLPTPQSRTCEVMGGLFPGFSIGAGCWGCRLVMLIRDLRKHEEE